MQNLQISSSNWVLEMPVAVNKEMTLVIGGGEIGKSLKNVLGSVYKVFIRDIQEDDEVNANWYRVIHICYSYSSQFIEITKEYITKYKPELTIIHGTVAPGTTAKLGRGVVHSPINGRHPHLEEGIKTFTKFVGGNDVFSVFKAIHHLNAAGMTTQAMANSTTTELAKVLCTRRLGLSVIEMKEAARLCEQYGVPFQEVFTEWNNSYNDAYSKLGEYRFIRPVLYPMPGEIGGHCVVPNLELIPEDEITKLIKGRNEVYKNEVKILELPKQGLGNSKSEARSLKNDKSKRKGRKKYSHLES